MAAGPAREPSRHGAHLTTHPASRGAPGAKGDRLRIRRTPSGAPDGHHRLRTTELCPRTTKSCNLTVNTTNTYRERCVAARPRATVLAMLLLASVPVQTPSIGWPARDDCYKNRSKKGYPTVRVNNLNLTHLNFKRIL